MSSAEVRVGDWRDVLPGTYDPARAVVVTDPPFGLVGLAAPGSHPGQSARETVALGRGFEDVIPWADHVRAVLELLPARRHVIRGPAMALIRRDYPPARRLCVEVSTYRGRSTHRIGTVPYLWQGWAVYGRLRLERHATMPLGDAITVRHNSEDDPPARRSRHRALTPIRVASWIVSTWADPGDLVLDPYAGTGAIGRAARAHGFDYLGAELDPEYAAIAREGFDTERLALGL